MDAVLKFLPLLLDAALLTARMFVTIAVLSVTLGLMLALVVRFFFPPLGAVARLYSLFFRGVPDLVVLLACYLALPQVGVELSPVGAAVLGFVLIRLAYDYELFRGAFNAIDPGQIEASRALGMPRSAMIRRVLLPQVARVVVAPWITLAVGALKALPLASAVAVPEIMYVTRQGIVATGDAFQFIFVAALLYGAISSVLMLAEARLEKRANYLDVPGGAAR